MRIGQKIINEIVPWIVRTTGAEKGSWTELRLTSMLQAIIMFPIKRIRCVRRNEKFVENQYDQISGMYIKDNYYEEKMRYSVVSGQIKKISSIDNMRLIRREMRQIMSEYSFKSVLEIGSGELTSLEDVYVCFGPDIECYGIDLSLNRLVHGLKEYEAKHDKLPVVAKANAIQLPFPDNSFDLVYTRHTLEQMPLIYMQALDEIFRVARKDVILFEPSYKLGSLSQKLKMLNSDYVKGISSYVANHPLATLRETYLMKNSANPLNHTACYKIEAQAERLNKKQKSNIEFVCPVSKSELKPGGGYLYSNVSFRAYPIINGVPVLDENYSFYINHPDLLK